MERLKQVFLTPTFEEEQIRQEENCLKRIEAMRKNAKNVYTDESLLQSLLDGLDASYDNSKKHLELLRQIQQDKVARRTAIDKIIQERVAV